jgi:hypothetical protein
MFLKVLTAVYNTLNYWFLTRPNTNHRCGRGMLTNLWSGPSGIRTKAVTELPVTSVVAALLPVHYGNKARQCDTYFWNQEWDDIGNQSLQKTHPYLLISQLKSNHPIEPSPYDTNDMICIMILVAWDVIFSSMVSPRIHCRLLIPRVAVKIK